MVSRVCVLYIQQVSNNSQKCDLTFVNLCLLSML